MLCQLTQGFIWCSSKAQTFEFFTTGRCYTTKYQTGVRHFRRKFYQHRSIERLPTGTPAGMRSSPVTAAAEYWNQHFAPFSDKADCNCWMVSLRTASKLLPAVSPKAAPAKLFTCGNCKPRKITCLYPKETASNAKSLIYCCAPAE